MAPGIIIDNSEPKLQGSSSASNEQTNCSVSESSLREKEIAASLLRESSWFRDFAPELITSLASHMRRMEIEDGSVLVHEGEQITDIIVLEEGTLQRTKQSADTAEDIEPDQVNESPLTPPPTKQKSLLEKGSCVPVDEISGRARVTGLLHNVKEGSVAFATISAKGKATVWLLAGADFRSVVTNTPERALDMLAAMARELRVGSKSVRGLLQRLKTDGKSDNASATDTSSSAVPRKVCRVLCYDATSWVTDGFKPAVDAFNKEYGEEGKQEQLAIEMDFTTERLDERSAMYAAGYDAVCTFVNDTANSSTIQTLSLLGVQMIAQRSAGFDRIDTKAARAYGMTVARVPAYSPYAVAEMAIALLMAVNRKVHRASNRVKMANFSLDAGLMGMDIHGKTVGVMGTGNIGQILCNILLGFGVNLLCYDIHEHEDLKNKGATYVSKDEIFKQSDILFLMMPLLGPTYHTINTDVVMNKLKRGMILINTSRGGLVDTKALLMGVKEGIIASVGMDVYENEADYFFQDWSAKQVQDQDLVALLGNNNVVLTAHQAFFTKEAVDKIVSTTIDNIHHFLEGRTGQDHPNNCIPTGNK